MYDVIVIGARCAGATTAMLLARAGVEVLLVDRAALASDIPHGHFVHRDGPRRLARWGLLEQVLATNCPPVTSMTSDFGDGALAGADLTVDGVPLGVAPRRTQLDSVLVRAAVDAGRSSATASPSRTTRLRALASRVSSAVTRAAAREYPSRAP